MAHRKTRTDMSEKADERLLGDDLAAKAPPAGEERHPDWDMPDPLDTLGGFPLDKLPEGARHAQFSDLAAHLAQDPRGFAILTGVERGCSGLEAFRSLGYGSGESPGSTFSFCVNGVTYTAFENPQDGYRSCLGHLVARDGNHCQTAFEPCALLPRFRSARQRGYSDDPEEASVEPAHFASACSDIFALFAPGGGAEPALAVGTTNTDDYYPSFVGWHSPELLQKARDFGLALAYSLDESLPAPSEEPAPRSRPRL